MRNMKQVKTGKPTKILDLTIVTLTICATFLLIIRTGNIKNGVIKPFDLIVTIIGIIILFYPNLIKKIEPIYKDLKFYFISLFLIFLFIIFGQIISFFYYGNTDISTTTLLYGRLIFNNLVFFITAILIYLLPKITIKINQSILFSPILILPIMFDSFKNLYYNSIRLNGLSFGPNDFCGLLIIIFLIGLASFLSVKNIFYKFIIIGWLGFIVNLIFLTGSRAGWVSFFLSIFIWICIYVFMKRKKEIFFIIIATLISVLVGFFLIPNNTKLYFIDRFLGDRFVQILNMDKNITDFVPQYKNGMISNQIRPQIWNFSLSKIEKNPLGFGFSFLNKNPTVINGEVIGFTTNIFLEIAIYGGIGGLFIFVLFLLKLGNELRHYIKILTDFEFVWGIIIISLIIDLSFIDGFLFRYLWFALGVVLGIILIKKYPKKLPDVSQKSS